MARIVLNTFGSLGDLHPYLAIAIELRKRGHQPLIATSAVYRDKVHAEHIDFTPVRPDVGQLAIDTHSLEKVWHPRRGPEYLLRQYLIPRVEESYQDLRDACNGADLLLTHPAAYAGQIAAEAARVPWLSVVLQPLLFFSAYDPPVLPPAPWLRHFYRLRPALLRALLRLIDLRTRRWAEPIQRLRTRAGLPRSHANPMTAGQFSPLGTLALFSPHFAQAQPDWPPHARITGFIFYDRQGPVPGAPPEVPDGHLAAFLENGPAPVLFTLGSSAVMQPGTFFHEAIAAVRRLGLRAVMLTGSVDQIKLAVPASDSIYITGYLPYSQIMPKSLAIVHQGGIGTTAQALRAGRPMLVVPWSHDQPDNAYRLQRLGVTRILSRRGYNASRLARELELLLHNETYAGRARALAAQIATEDGLASACDAIEEFLSA